tara:strand:- start:511 stop:708 length:198 start_codon:yes stop_codon:yes gene_type:complete
MGDPSSDPIWRKKLKKVKEAMAKSRSTEKAVKVLLLKEEKDKENFKKALQDIKKYEQKKNLKFRR